ncbi:Transposon Ty3-G Gag-Pol polyprotein [Araneus ventricosus]|uniref:Transposon Ty3-G Gag-Pol polyprotein n=1 Tax=Araneus ventricosus TaxID=182803 RepID=A0A4Y2VHR9_ARAVE|nr:Transposon Ty3-G Gag-Pol polyprotein [Araneus ventricosus]
MSTIGSIGEFDVSNPISWDNYAEQLKFFLEANEITNAEKKRAVLLAVCGIKTLGVLRSLLAPESPSTKSYDDLIKVLKEHFAPTSSGIYRRFQFHKRLQHNNETVSSYVTELRRLAEECNFGATLTERLRDQLVCGIKDEALQRRLLAESTLTFNEAFLRAVAAESAAEQAKHIHSQKFNTGNSTNLIRQHSNNNKRTFQKSSSSQSKPGNAQSADVICYGCGGHHDRSSCKFRDVTCRFCKKKGHVERACRAKRKNDSMPRTGHMHKNSSTHAVKSESVNEAAAIYNLSDLKNTKCKQMKRNVSIQLGEGECIMELDSGSDYSIISSDELDRLWPNKKPKIFPFTFQLCDYQKSPIRIRGQIYVNVRYANFKGKLRLLIAEGSRANLLGMEWFEPLGIKFVGVYRTEIDIEFVLEEFKDVFSEDLGSYKGPAISLPIDPKFPPISFKARNIPLAMRKKVDVAIDKLLDQGVLEPISNPRWSTPIVPIIKQSGEIRLCADYKVTINKAMKNHPFPIPSVNHILANLADGKFFAKIDLAQAYLQLKVDDASAEAQTIVTHRGAFKVNRLQFGVNVAPGLFQNFIEDLLKGIPGVFPYFDDVLIFAATEEQLCNHLRLVLERLSESGIRANKNKCIFKTKAVEFLGFVIDASGIHPSDSKVRTIHEAPCPKNKTELQAFLGLLNFYHSFLKDKATIAEPLHRLLEKNAEWKWTSAHEKAFAAVKELLSSDSVLVPFNEKLPLILTCDASPYGVGYVLSHLMPDGREAPIAYASRTLTSTERNYSQLDKEALSIIAGVKKFHYFLYGHTFTLVTDHQPLLGLFNKMKLTPDILSPRMLRWSQMLNAYNFTIIHRPGKKIQNADALSRLPLEIPETDIPSPPEVLFLEELHNPPVKADEISQATLRDPVLSRVLNWVLKGLKYKKVSNTKIKANCQSSVHCIDRLPWSKAAYRAFPPNA